MSERSVSTRRPPGDEPVTEEMLLSDLLGFAGYLADEGVDIDLARAELAEAAATESERRALRGAARRASSEWGNESPLARLLRSAADEPPDRAHVA